MKVQITINSVDYPCYMTMGAMVRFADELGHEMSQFNGSVKDLCGYVWACTVGACRRQGVAFDMSFMDFCDAVDPEDIQRAFAIINKGNNSAEVDESKKK